MKNSLKNPLQIKRNLILCYNFYRLVHQEKRKSIQLLKKQRVFVDLKKMSSWFLYLEKLNEKQIVCKIHQLNKNLQK